MRYLCVLPSGRSFDCTHLGENRIRDLAEEFTTIVWTRTDL